MFLGCQIIQVVFDFEIALPVSAVLHSLSVPLREAEPRLGSLWSMMYCTFLCRARSSEEELYTSVLNPWAPPGRRKGVPWPQ